MIWRLLFKKPVFSKKTLPVVCIYTLLGFISVMITMYLYVKKKRKKKTLQLRVCSCSIIVFIYFVS